VCVCVQGIEVGGGVKNAAAVYQMNGCGLWYRHRPCSTCAVTSCALEQPKCCVPPGLGALLGLCSNPSVSRWRETDCREPVAANRSSRFPKKHSSFTTYPHIQFDEQRSNTTLWLIGKKQRSGHHRPPPSPNLWDIYKCAHNRSK